MVSNPEFHAISDLHFVPSRTMDSGWQSVCGHRRWGRLFWSI